MTATPDDPLLYRIFESLGDIKRQLTSGSERHKEMAHGIADLDIKFDGLTERVAKVEALAARIPIIEPAVWEHEAHRIEGAAVRKFWGGVMTKGRAAVGIVGGSIGAAITAIGTWLAHVFHGGAPPPH
jgi:hypothetical protein